jgi:hypothetical protein
LHLVYGVVQTHAEGKAGGARVVRVIFFGNVHHVHVYTNVHHGILLDELDAITIRGNDLGA